MKNQLVVLAVVAALPVFNAQAAAQDPLLACADIPDTAARLACFDRTAAEARALASPTAPAATVTPPSATTPAPAVVAPAAPAPVAPAPVPAPASAVVPQGAGQPSSQGTRPAFGEEQLRGRAPAPVEESLQARITEARRSAGGLYLVILDNGQVWRHEMGSMADYLLAGEAVTIRKSGLSYRLTLDDGKNKNWVRVTRVR